MIVPTRILCVFQSFIIIFYISLLHVNNRQYLTNTILPESMMKTDTKVSNSSSLFVALSVNNYVRYAYLLPFVIEGWLRCGIQPVLVLIESEETWMENNCTSMVIRYLHERKIILRHLTNRSLIDKYTSNILSRTSRLAVPHILNELGMSPDSIVWTGDADVIPLKCDYFQSIPLTMKQRNVQVYMDGPWDMSIPRYLMCYIAGYLSVWKNLTEQGSSIEQVMEKTLAISNVQMAYGDLNRTKPEYDFDEYFLGRRIKKLSCFPNCTTHGQPPVRNCEEFKRGPGRPPFNWTEALGDHPHKTIDFLSKLIEAHSGVREHSFSIESSWPIFHRLILIFMERIVTDRLSHFSNEYFRLDCSKN
ncbi:hypothetical protein I4U23_003885 [Adineta vaga]|nr:hypothetical protein I4U23_003885 [Adineta vaga]